MRATHRANGKIQLAHPANGARGGYSWPPSPYTKEEGCKHCPRAFLASWHCFSVNLHPLFQAIALCRAEIPTYITPSAQLLLGQLLSSVSDPAPLLRPLSPGESCPSPSTLPLTFLLTLILFRFASLPSFLPLPILVADTAFSQPLGSCSMASTKEDTQGHRGTRRGHGGDTGCESGLNTEKWSQDQNQEGCSSREYPSGKGTKSKRRRRKENSPWVKGMDTT